MKTLSIQQPWAWLIVNGHKSVENRDWPCRLRGEILIHTGKKFDLDGYLWIRKAFPSIEMPTREGFDLGGIIGKATITGCVTHMDSPWFFGRYGFVLVDAVTLPLHPCKGRLGFFEAEVPNE